LVILLLVFFSVGCGSPTAKLSWVESDIGSDAEKYIVEKSYDGIIWNYYTTTNTNKIVVEYESVEYYIRVIGVDKIHRYSVPSDPSEPIQKEG